MTSLPTPAIAASAPPSRLSALVLRVAAALAALRRAGAHRRQITEVLRLDDHMLKDIGLTRSDVLDAVAGRAGVDPSLQLRLRRSEDQLPQRDREIQVGRVTKGSRRRFRTAPAEHDLKAA